MNRLLSLPVCFLHWTLVRTETVDVCEALVMSYLGCDVWWWFGTVGIVSGSSLWNCLVSTGRVRSELWEARAGDRGKPREWARSGRKRRSWEKQGLSTETWVRFYTGGGSRFGEGSLIVCQVGGLGECWVMGAKERKVLRSRKVVPSFRCYRKIRGWWMRRCPWI